MIGKTRARATMPVYPFALISALVRVVQRLLRPARSAVEVGIGAAQDLTRTRSMLLAENAFLCQQLNIYSLACSSPVGLLRSSTRRAPPRR